MGRGIEMLMAESALRPKTRSNLVVGKPGGCVDD